MVGKRATNNMNDVTFMQKAFIRTQNCRALVRFFVCRSVAVGVLKLADNQQHSRRQSKKHIFLTFFFSAEPTQERTTQMPEKQWPERATGD